MEISPQSYFFVGLNETSRISEAIRNLCLGNIGLSYEYFKTISRISAKTICAQLSDSLPPLQFCPNELIPTNSHFNWVASKFSQTFGGKNNPNIFYLNIFELKSPKNKEFSVLFDFIINNQNNSKITPRFLINLYKHDRNLFITLIPCLGVAYELFEPRELLDRIPRFDHAVISLIDEEYAIIRAAMDVPEARVEEHPYIVQSIIESNNPRIQKSIQDLLATVSLPDDDRNLEAVRLSIEGDQHFDDMILKPLISFMKSQQFKTAVRFAHDRPGHITLAYIMCFNDLIKNRMFLQDTISEIMEISQQTPPILHEFIECINNDLNTFDTVFKLVGQKVNFDDLMRHSIFYFMKDILPSLQSYDNFCFLRDTQSYVMENGSIDFSFIVSYIALSSVFKNYNEEVLVDCLNQIEDPLQIRWLLVDLFSILFVKDSEGKFAVPIDVVISVIKVVNKFTDYSELKRYTEHAINKYNCIKQNELTTEKMLEPTESFIHPLLVEHQFEKAKTIIELSPKFAQFVELLERIEAYTQNLIYVPPLTTEENEKLFNIEIGLSTGEERYLEKSAKYESLASPIIKKRLENNNPLTAIQLNYRILQNARSFDTTFKKKDSVLKKFVSIGDSKMLNSLYDYLNVYIQAGATTPSKLKRMEVHETLDYLISMKQFDLALEFAGVNRIDFFQFLFVKYKANESILRLISPMYPLASFTMACLSLSPKELMQFRDIIIPKNASKQLIWFFNSKVAPKEEHDDKLDLYSAILMDSKKDLDDLLFAEDPNKLKEVVLSLKFKIPIARLTKLLEFVSCFVEDKEVEDLRHMTMFLIELDDPPTMLKEVIESSKVERKIKELISLERYLSAKKLSDYTKKMKSYWMHMLQHITKMIKNNEMIMEPMKHCKEFHEQMIERIPQNSYEIRYNFIKNSSVLLEDPTFNEEYKVLSVYFFVPENRRPENASINEIVSLLVKENDITEIKRVAAKFSINFSIFIKHIASHAMEIINSFGTDLSLPLLVPIINSIISLLDEYKDISCNCEGFGEEFIPVAAFLVAFVNVDCIEHESFCAETLVVFRFFLNKISKLCGEKGKKNIEVIAKKLELVRVLESISFFSRFYFPYGSDLVTTDNRAEEIHYLLVDNDFNDIAKIFMPQSVVSDRKHLFMLLMLNEYDEARAEFSGYSDRIKKSDFKTSRDFIMKLNWALKSPLCFDKSWMEKPSSYKIPTPVFVAAKAFIEEKKPAFAEKCVEECVYYMRILSSTSDVLRYLVSNNKFDKVFEILFKEKFDSSLFVHCVLTQSLSYGNVDEMLEMLLEYDKYLENSLVALCEAIEWCKRMELPSLRYKIAIMSGDFDSAVEATEELYGREPNKAKRAEIIQTCIDEVPPEVLALNAIHLQIRFVALEREKGLKIAPDVHMFNESVHKALAVLFENKQYEFAFQVINELSVNPTEAVNIISKKMNLSKAKKFVATVEKMATPSVFQAITTVLLRNFNEDPKTASYVKPIIDKVIVDSRVKCNFYIQFKMLESAKKVAKKENLTEFIELFDF